jgi:hypothetical protein
MMRLHKTQHFIAETGAAVPIHAAPELLHTITFVLFPKALHRFRIALDDVRLFTVFTTIDNHAVFNLRKNADKFPKKPTAGMLHSADVASSSTRIALTAPAYATN